MTTGIVTCDYPAAPGVTQIADRGVLMKPLRTKARIKRLHVIQDRANKQIAARIDGPVSCTKGCSACCTQWIGVFWLEAEAAIEEARRAGFTIDPAELALQSELALTPGMTRRKWWGTRCIFLTPENTCAIYARRPIACRSVAVASEPVNCSRPDAMVSRYKTFPAAITAYDAIRMEQHREVISDAVGAMPLLVDLALRGKTPNDIRDKTNKHTGVIGIDGNEQTIGGKGDVCEAGGSV